MDRRKYLTAIAAVGTGTVTGCGRRSESDDETTPTATDTARPPATTADKSSPTPTDTTTDRPTTTEAQTTTTPDHSYPEIIRYNTIYTWQEPGDVADNTISQFGIGGGAVFGYTVKLETVDGMMNVETGDRIYDSDGNVAVSDQRSITTEAEPYATGEAAGEKNVCAVDGSHTWFTGPTTDYTFEPGTYYAEVVARDNRTGTRDRQIIEFELVNPLERDELSIATKIPDTVPADETFDYTLAFTNLTDQDNNVYSRIRMRHETDNQWADLDIKLGPAIRAHQTDEVTLTQPPLLERGTWVVELVDLNFQYELQVVD